MLQTAMSSDAARSTARRCIILCLLAGGAFAGSCGGDSPPPPAADAAPGDARAEDANALDAAASDASVASACPDLALEPGALVGCVVDESGRPIAGAEVTRGPLTATTDARGVFAFAQVAAGNALLAVEHPGHASEHIAHRAPDERALVIPLMAAPAGRVRLIFGGDVSFGRRFLDSDDSTPRGEMPPDDPDALILVSDPLPGSLAALVQVAPHFQSADIAVINLESAVTDNPADPHPTKEFVYFSLPGSVPALLATGIDYVSLGNNHIYDYLAAGLGDTLAHLDAAGLPHSGAGADPEAAFLAHEAVAGGHTYALLSMTSIAGAEHAIPYVASETQGGAADLRDSARVAAAISAHAQAGRLPIVQYHMGFEYAFEAAPVNIERMQSAIDSGAVLAIGHHPHVAQGFGFYQGKLLAHSLGNLLFDQDRLETMLGVLVRVDLDGDNLAAARAIPVYLEDYRPRPVAGDLAARFLRRLAEFSRAHGALVVPYLGQGWIVPAGEPIAITSRNLAATVDIPASGVAVLDLRALAAADESLAHLSADRPDVTLRAGRDLLLYGDFEDWDTDQDTDELVRWDFGTSVTLCASPLRGRGALCSERSSTNTVPSRIFLRNRVRVMGEAVGMPNKDVSLVLHGRGDNAGAVAADIAYLASIGAAEFGSDSYPLFAPGTYDPTLIAVDLALPADDPTADPNDGTAHARALRLVLRHDQPPAGTGVFAVDDVALVNWEDDITDAPIPVPHARDFVRIQGPPGPVTLALTLSRTRPLAVAP